MCLWINEGDLSEAMSIEAINRRVQLVKNWRGRKGVTALAYEDVPYRFKGINTADHSLLIIPAVSSHTRTYIPMGFLSADHIVTDLAFMILDPEVFVFSLLSSAMHNNWVSTVTGRLGNGYRYSLGVCYNSFPVPSLSESNLKQLEKSGEKILSAREFFAEKSLAELYSKDDMPSDLMDAHLENDMIVDKIYSKNSMNETTRVELLIKMYAEKITNE